MSGLEVVLKDRLERCVVCDTSDADFARLWFTSKRVAVCDEHYHLIESFPFVQRQP